VTQGCLTTSATLLATWCDPLLKGTPRDPDLVLLVWFKHLRSYQVSVITVKGKPLTVNDFWPCILENATAVQGHLAIIELSAAFLGKNAFHNFVTMT